jgi:hypothetical protein
MAINKGPGNGEQIVSIMHGYNNKTNVTTDNHNSIILGSNNVIGDRLNALVVGDNLTIENDGIATNNLTVTSTLNGRAVSDILPTYTKYIALISQSSALAPTVIELENTIGPIFWTRTAVGTYQGTLTGVFTVGKTYAMISNVEPNGVVRIDTVLNYIQIITTDLHNPTAALHDSHLNKNTLEIRVYE